MWLRLFTDNLVHLCGNEIAAYSIYGEYNNKLVIRFFCKEQAINFKQNVIHCNQYNKGCNLILNSLNSDTQLLFHNIHISYHEPLFLDNIDIDLEFTNYFEVDTNISSEQLFDKMKYLIHNNNRSKSYKLMIDKILEEE